MTALAAVPESGPLVAKKPDGGGAVSVTKVTKAEEAIFNLKPGKDALVRLAGSLEPFAPIFDFVCEGLQWKNTQRAMVVQAVFCFAVLYSYTIVPGLLVTLGLCTLSHKKEESSAEEEGGGAEGGDGGGAKAAVAEKPAGGSSSASLASTSASLKSRAKSIDVATLQRAL